MSLVVTCWTCATQEAQIMALDHSAIQTKLTAACRGGSNWKHVSEETGIRDTGNIFSVFVMGATVSKYYNFVEQEKNINSLIRSDGRVG